MTLMAIRTHTFTIRAATRVCLAATLFVLGAMISFAHAAEVVVSTPGELTATAALASPGDVIVMRDGVWQDADVLFVANGTAESPITLRAQTLGAVHLSGQSRLRMGGSFLVVDGLVFTNGYRTSDDVIAFRDTTTTYANNSRITNCAIIGYNPPNPTNDVKWVSLYGVSNRVENCYFRGKQNVGTLLVVWVNTNTPNYHVVSRNYCVPGGGCE